MTNQVFPILLFLLSSLSIFSQEKTIVREFTYNASDIDSKISSRANAQKELRALILNEIGVYVESERILTTLEVGEEFSQNFVENITTLAGGITKLKVLEEKWNGEIFWMKASITFNEDSLANSLKKLINNRDLLKDLNEFKIKLQESEDSILNLKRKIDENKNINIQKVTDEYNSQIKEIIAIEYFNEGHTSYSLKQYKKALAKFTAAIELYPKHSQFFFMRGMAKSMLKDYYGAIEDFKEGMKYSVNDSQALFKIAIQKSHLNDNVGAIETMDKAIESEPENADMIFYRGILKTESENYSGSIDDFSLLIKLNPNMTFGYHNRGVTKYKSNDYFGAIKDYDKVIELNPNDNYTYILRGLAKKKAGISFCSDFKKACDLGNCEKYNEFCN